MNTANWITGVVIVGFLVGYAVVRIYFWKRRGK